MPQCLTDHCTKQSCIFWRFFMQTLVWLILMSVVSYFDLCSILLVSFHYKCLSGMLARFWGKGNRDYRLYSFPKHLSGFISISAASGVEDLGYHVHESSHDQKAATPVAKLKHLPSSFIGGPQRFHPADWVARGRGVHFLDTLRLKVNGVMTHFMPIAGFSSAREHTRGAFSRMSDTVITGWRLNLLLAERTCPYSHLVGT